MQLLTAADTASLLNIDTIALGVLVKNGDIPCHFFDLDTGGAQALRFTVPEVENWIEKKNTGNYAMDMNGPEYIKQLREMFLQKYPKAMAELKEFDRQFSPPTRKYYSLSKEKRKNGGFVYYVRYYNQEKKELYGTRWCTFTSNLDQAKMFAEVNRDRLVSEYLAKKKPKVDLYGILENYYKKDSEYTAIREKRNEGICEHQRRTSYNFIIKTFIPYLIENGVKLYSDITPVMIRKLQDTLLLKGNKPQTVNDYISHVRAVFEDLHRAGKIDENVFDMVKNIKVTAKDRKTHGCYELEQLNGVFNRDWKDKRSYILNLLIYTTNMRNSEIERVRLQDIINLDDIHVIKINQSKTVNGERLVPLHPFVYAEIINYAEREKKQPDDMLFLFSTTKNQSTLYKKAYLDMAEVMGFTSDMLARENITYYSGRHYWKTLMSAEGLGDVDECFMGHRVTGDVKARYDHKDKQGRRRLLEKARRVFAILDQNLFNTPAVLCNLV